MDKDKKQYLRGSNRDVTHITNTETLARNVSRGRGENDSDRRQVSQGKREEEKPEPETLRGKRGEISAFEESRGYRVVVPTYEEISRRKISAVGGKRDILAFDESRRKRGETHTSELPRVMTGTINREEFQTLKPTKSKAAETPVTPSPRGRNTMEAKRLSGGKLGYFGRQSDEQTKFAREQAGKRSEREIEEAALALEENLWLAELNLERIKTHIGKSRGTTNPREKDRGVTIHSGEEEEKGSFPMKLEFLDKAEDLDAYLDRFERMTQVEEREQKMLARRYSASLRDKALDVYKAVREEDATDHAKEKESHMHRFRAAAESHRQKTRSIKRLGELVQLVARMRAYVDTWKDLVKEAKTSQSLADLLRKEQFLQTVKPELAVFIRERGPLETDEDTNQTY